MGEKRIAVFGSNSFSGADFIDLLLDDADCHVLGLSRSPEKSALFLPYRKRAEANFRFEQADMNHDGDRILHLLDEFQPHYVVNFAAQSEVAPSWKHPDHWFQTNAVALSWLLIRLKDRPYLQRYMHISSPEVYGTCVGTVTEDSPMNPTTPYAASKAAADFFLATLVKNFNFPLITIRATNVYGAHQQLWKIIPRSAIYVKRCQTIQLHGGGTAVKSFIHIRDVSRGEALALFHGELGGMYHLSPDNRGYAVRDVVKRVCDLTGHNFEKSTQTVGERLGQDAAYIIDSTRARSELGWQPTISLDEGLQGVIEWVDANWNEICHASHEYSHAA